MPREAPVSSSTRRGALPALPRLAPLDAIMPIPCCKKARV
jgi:hypothetical protein